MKKVICKAMFVASLALFLASFSNAQSIRGSIANGTVTKGKPARATVVLSIPSGLHVNSNRPGNENSIPTIVTPSARGVRLGAVTYPRGRNRRFGFSQNTINVYEGTTVFTFLVTVPLNFTGSTVRVNVKVRYQACTDEVCYLPKTKTITLTARVV